MKKLKLIMATLFLTVLSTSLVHAASVTISHNSDYYIAYGYVRSSDNDANTIYMTIGECSQRNAAVSVYVRDSNNVVRNSTTAYTGQTKTAIWKATAGTRHSHTAASALIQ